MQKKMIREADSYVAGHRRRRIWQRIVGGLACVVVFCTTYALILPAITMEKYDCGMTEHTHTAACYTRAAVSSYREPVCTLENLNLHEHDADCYDEDGTLVCGYADFAVHEHDKSCYDEDGSLWCPLPEIGAHTHDKDCYAQPEGVHTHGDDCYTVERGELICTESEEDAHTHDGSCYTEREELVCGQEESDGHQHDDSCYDEAGELICGEEESEGHTHSAGCYETSRVLTCGLSEDAHRHTDECYKQNKVLICDLPAEPEEDSDAEPELVCDKEEIILHTHKDSCFDENGTLICGKQEVLEHVHSEDCFQTVETAADADALTCTIPEGDGAHTHSEDCYDEAGELICGMEESEGHQHSALCYGTWELTCGLEEHTHTEACTAAELTEEEQTQVDEVIALIDALPTQKEIEEKLTAFEDAGDEDGYDAYLAEVIAQVKEAHEAYEALSEAQKLKVTNAVRLMALEPLWSAQTLEIKEKLTDDSAYVSGIAVTNINDGTGPFDDNDNVGNDSSAKNKIVRTFDTVTYEFEVTMASYNTSNTYSEARVKLEFVLPLTADQATFDQGAMAWMDQTTGYAPALTTETRTINGVETQCQVLTCYMHLLPSEGHSSVVPGTFGENVTINVKSMKNKEQFAPIFSAAMEYGTWEGDCTEHNQAEKATVTADKITVSAAPKYNIRIGGSASYKTTFDFSTGNETAKAYGAGYFTENSQVTGRVIKYGVVIQLYNDNASKGLKGIELPDGSDITFDLNVSSQFTINMPNAGSSYTQGAKVDTTEEYTPLLWSCDQNLWTTTGQTNRDGRVLYDSHGCAQAWAPYASGGGANACYNSGTWTATQDGSTIHVTVSGYQIDVDKMPTTNGDTTTGSTGAYGIDLGIGCFSAGELWLVQPYNRIGGSSNNQGPNFDVVTEYGQGKFDTNVKVVNMKAKTVSGSKFEDSEGTSDAQTRTSDDMWSTGVELTLPGGLQNRVAYANPTNYNWGVGVYDYRNGLDFATPGTEIRLLGGFSYNHKNEEENTLYWGTNLTKFYGSAIEITTNIDPSIILSGGANAKDFTVLYATKKDGTDWASDDELLHTYEDDMVFYKSLSEIPKGHLCVGLLFCFKEDIYNTDISEPYFFIQQPAKVRDNMDLSGKSYMLASTSRVWTKAMFEQKGMTLDSIPDWTNPNTKLSSFPAGYYKSANIEGSTWYVKTDYSKVAETGAVTDHNSDWRHWGDTLLVIGYKTGITKNLVQKGDGNTDKNTYNLDAEQRVVDFKLQPRTYYDQSSGNHSLTTTVTIVDALPKYLTYRPGSAYFGGTYTQTSVNGGTQGTITGGELLEPTVTNNPDGTQTLTWVITNVTVGEDMPAIYYSADIGNRNNPDEDVPTGTTNLVNQVRISATHDIRQPSLANGNYAEAGIAVTRGSASSFGKYSKQKLVEPDGVIDYVVYFDNNSVSAADVVLMDTMPYNGISGSHFNGTYTVNSWKLDVSKCDVGKLTLYYTMDEQYKDATTASLGGNAAAKNTIQSWTNATIALDGTVTELKDTRPVAWAILGTLENNKRIQVDMQVQLQPDQSTTGNEIQNNYYVNTVSSGETTIHTETPTVNRTLEGLTWMDDNADGIQNENTDRRISGVKVELLKLKENGDSTKESDYESYCYPGTTTPIVIETGKQISVRASKVDAATDYELGRYKFTDLPAGTFAVRFTDGNKKISPLIASPDNRGTDDTLDSDGKATYSTDRSTLEKTVILGIELPKAENMSVTLFESKYHDSGFYEKGHELPMTGGPGATPYTIGGLVAAIGAGLLLLYKDKRRRKKKSASS